MRGKTISACLLLVATDTWAGPPGWTPRLDQVRALERHVEMPSGAHPLWTYDRRYAGMWEGKRRVILGSYIANPSGRGSVSIVPPDRLPAVPDAGCAALTLRHLLRDRSPAVARCGSRLAPAPHLEGANSDARH